MPTCSFSSFFEKKAQGATTARQFSQCKGPCVAIETSARQPSLSWRAGSPHPFGETAGRDCHRTLRP
eukprot:2782527-Alexandrium_andersonii.AAC.1